MKQSPLHIAVATALSLATLSCFAAPTQSAPTATNDSHIYVGLNGSYIHSDWKTMIHSKNQGEPSYSTGKT